jgi:hypothetical protein
METDKQTIFISHVAPTDNYFAAWLASKLKLLGYSVWVELDELKVGDAFWPNIEAAIRKDAIRFIAVVSKEYCEKVRVASSGVFKELSCADRIKSIPNFLAPVRIDETPEDDFPVQLMGLQSIDFFQNWQVGLDRLLKDLREQKVVAASSDAENPLPFWLDAFKIDEIRTKGPETIFTNWFPVHLPEKIYVHHPVIERQIDLQDIYYPYIVEANRHVCFFPSSDYPASISCVSSKEYTLDEFLSDRVLAVDEFFALFEPRKKLVKLLNQIVERFCVERVLKRYNQANTAVFYYPSNSENKKRISLKRFGKSNVTVTGSFKEHKWCFGFSWYANLVPSPFFKINAHIIFENPDGSLPDSEEQHALRQACGASWYNKKWLDTTLGAMTKLSGDDLEGLVRVPISSSKHLEIQTSPFAFETDFGYLEPVKTEMEDD